MARNGSGTYSNPYPDFISGTVISSTEVDANNSDIATALTQSIAVDGQSVVTGDIPLATHKFTAMKVGTASTDSLSLGQAQAEAFVWCGTASGGADAITLSPSPAITAYAAGQRFVWMASGSTNTGATTVAISGLTAIALQDNGAALTAGQHAAGKMFMGILNTTSTVQIMQVQVSGTDPLIVSSLTVTGDATIGDDLTLLSDASILGFGEHTDVKITHVADSGLTLKNTSTGDDTPFVLLMQTGETDIALNDALAKIQFQAPDEGAGTDAILVAAEIAAISEGDFSSSNNATKLSFKTAASGATSEKMSLSSGGNLTLPTDGVVIAAGVNSDVTLTHVHDTGLLLNSTMALQFNDASQYINAPTATVLDINATDEVEINATLADVNANLDVSGTYQGGGTMTTGGNIVIPDDGNIGSASDTDAIAIRSDGNVGINSSGSDTVKLYVYDNTSTDQMALFSQAATDNAVTAVQISQAGTGPGLYSQCNLGAGTAVYGYQANSGAAGIASRGHSVGGYGGYFATGSATYGGLIGYSADSSEYAILGYQNNYGVYTTSLTSGATKSFQIPHGLREGYDLVHSSIEGPLIDLIYRGKVDLVDGVASISMDTKFGMTAGTFEWLTKNPQTFTSNETGWDAVKSSFSGDTITIECQNTSSTDTISWMVVAERDDPNIRAASKTDSNGNLIVECPSDVPPPPLPPLPED